MSDSQTPKDEMPEGITREALTEAVATMIKRVSAQIPPEPEPVSQQTRTSGGGLVRARFIAVVVSALLTVASVFNCFLSVPWGWVLAVGGIVAGFCVPLLLLMEFLKCAGVQVHSQFKQGETYYREFSFHSSIRKFEMLAGLLVVGTIGLVVGYASLYASISRSIPQSFNGDANGFGSIYFSIVTFATVGFGDVYPVSTLARAVVVSEILFAWGLLALVFSSLVSWVTSNVQQRHVKMLKSEERRMQSVEAAIKAAGVGLYSGDDGLDKFVEEAKQTLAKKKAETK